MSFFKNFLADKRWTKSEFLSESNSVLARNCNGTYRTYLDFAPLVDKGSAEAIRLIEEETTLRKIKDKLNEYAGTRYALSKTGFNSGGKTSEKASK